MRVQEILEEVDLLVDNAIPTERKIRYINEIQKQTFRHFRNKTSSYFFHTMQDDSQYGLPPDCEPDNIIGLFIDDKEYYEKDADQYNTGRLYHIINGKMLIQPVPKTTMDCYLYYYPSPYELTMDDLQTVPSIPVDYHELLVLGCAKKVAMAMKDYNAAKVFEDRYLVMDRDAMIELSPKPKGVRRIRGWM